MTGALPVLLAGVLLAGCAASDRPGPNDSVVVDTASPRPTVTGVLAPDRPREDITPGVVITTERRDVCTPGWAAKHRRSLTAARKRRVLAAYGYPPDTKVSEWDHLIPLELGGGNGPKQIWPMVDRATDQHKDRLENQLHDDVCDGRLSLPEAQKRIKEFWLWW